MYRANNFNEKELVEKVSELGPRTEILMIPVERSSERYAGQVSHGFQAGTLTAAFETRELHSGPHSIYQIRFLPLFWVGGQSEDPRFFHRHYFTPSRTGYYNTFLLLVNHDEKQVKFGPSHNILLSDYNLRGIGIASYCFAQLIGWAQSLYPQYAVHPVTVGIGDAYEPSARDRRNRFYEKHGFRGIFNDAERSSGKYTIDSVFDLIASPLPSGWEKHDQYDLLARLLDDRIDKACQLIGLTEQNSVVWKFKSDLSKRLTRFQKMTALLGFTALVFLFVWIAAIGN